jgi:hypothetical protein
MRLSLIFFLLAISLSCGIQTLTVLNPPVSVDINEGLRTVKIVSPEDNPSNFLGIEIWYKFYDSSTAEDQFLIDKSEINASVNPSSQLIARQFRRLSRNSVGEQHPEPLAPIPQINRSEEVIVRINSFNDDFPTLTLRNETDTADISLAAYDGISNPFVVGRFIDPDTSDGDSSRSFVGFASVNINQEDVFVDSGSGYSLALAVACYGIDTINFTSIYSSVIFPQGTGLIDL